MQGLHTNFNRTTSDNYIHVGSSKKELFFKYYNDNFEGGVMKSIIKPLGPISFLSHPDQNYHLIILKESFVRLFLKM